jgi:predicted DNA-binding transcriptional regulator YafY
MKPDLNGSKHSKTYEDLPNGGCVMTLTVSHTLEMKPWIRGWGADCEVLEPEDLRQVIAKEMIAAGKVYECIEAQDDSM